MPIALSFAAGLILLAQATPAQDRPVQKPDASISRADQGASAKKPPAIPSQKEADEARARNEALERTWDERMRRTMRSICSGAQGC